MLAVETGDEVSHGLIGATRLHLGAEGVTALALFAGEEALSARPTPLLYQLICLEVCACRIKAVLHHLRSHKLQLITRQVLCVAGHKKVWGKGIIEYLNAKLWILFVSEI
jgi:hypothetical protein